MQDKVLDFLQATEQYKRRGAFIRVSASKNPTPDTTQDINKRQIQSKFHNAVSNAGPNPFLEICVKTGKGENAQVKSLVRYKAVKLWDGVGIFHG